MANRNRLRQTKKHFRTRKFHRTQTNNHRTRLLRQTIHVQPTNSTKTRRRQKNTRKTQKQKPKTRISNRPKPPNGNTKLQIQPISNGQRKKQTKNNQTNTTTSTKQTSNQK